MTLHIGDLLDPTYQTDIRGRVALRPIPPTVLITVRASTVVHRAVWMVDDACVNARPLSFRQKGHCSRWLRGANHASEIDAAHLRV